MAKDEQRDTDYIVLEQTNASTKQETWTPINDRDELGELVPIPARGSDAAIRTAIRIDPAANGEVQGSGTLVAETTNSGASAEEAPADEYRDGSFKAIPVRSWKGGLTNRNRTVRQSSFTPLD